MGGGRVLETVAEGVFDDERGDPGDTYFRAIRAARDG
jgi:hypothetical protein